VCFFYFFVCLYSCFVCLSVFMFCLFVCLCGGFCLFVCLFLLCFFCLLVCLFVFMFCLFCCVLFVVLNLFISLIIWLFLFSLHTEVTSVFVVYLATPRFCWFVYHLFVSLMFFFLFLYDFHLFICLFGLFVSPVGWGEVGLAAGPFESWPYLRQVREKNYLPYKLSLQVL